METDLRLWLSIVGVLIIVVIMVDGIRHKYAKKDKHKLSKVKDNIQEQNLDLIKDANFLDDSLQAVSPDFEHELKSTKFKQNVIRSNSKLDFSSIDEIFSIIILPQTQTKFSGRSLKAILNSLGFIYSSKGVFNCHVNNNPSSKVIFSIACLKEPGTFDLNQMLRTTYPGLVLYTALSKQNDPLWSFETMLSKARRLSASINGELFDDSRSNLTSQTIAHYREKIKEMQLKQFSRHSESV